MKCSRSLQRCRSRDLMSIDCRLSLRQHGFLAGVMQGMDKSYQTYVVVNSLVVQRVQ